MNRIERKNARKKCVLFKTITFLKLDFIKLFFKELDKSGIKIKAIVYKCKPYRYFILINPRTQHQTCIAFMKYFPNSLIF